MWIVDLTYESIKKISPIWRGICEVTKLLQLKYEHKSYWKMDLKRLFFTFFLIFITC